MIDDAKILLTGPTSQVALPLACSLAQQHRVTGVARFSAPAAKERLEKAGVRCLPLDFVSDHLDRLDDDFDYVLHFGVVKTGEWEHDLTANVEGLGRLLAHCRNAKAVLHCSSGGVYAAPGQIPAKETDALGDNHASMMPTYSICKIAAESMARFAAKQWNVPTTIARLSVPFGDNGGWPWYHLMMMRGGVSIPVHPNGPSIYNPIHEDDYIAQVPRMLDIASIPATTVNWAGESVSIEEWCAYLGELTGLEPKFTYSDSALQSLPLDTTLQNKLVGPTKVGWREGIQRLVEARNPELLKS